MNIVITGATGFLGSAVARALVARGDRVSAVARETSDPWRLAGTAVTWHIADITDPAGLRELFGLADAVVHAAGRLGQFGVPQSDYFAIHEQGTRTVCEALAALPAPPRLLYISSPGVLGPVAGPPATEEQSPAPSNAYERSKAAGELVVTSFAEQGLPAIIVRPEFVYGPRDTHVLGLFRAIQQGRFFYIGDGENCCHPTYVHDAVTGIVAALDHGRVAETYHIAGPRPLSFREMGSTFAEALGVPAPRYAVPVPLARAVATVLEGAGRLSGMAPPLSRDGVSFFSENRAFSWAKAHRDLAYKPQTDLAEGARLTVDWYRRQGYL